MYLEGYENEGLIRGSDDAADGEDRSNLVNEEVHQSGGTTITDREYHTTFDGEPGEMAAFGITETTL